MSIVDRIIERLQAHPAVTSVELVGSRARGDAGPLSDWDLVVETSDFEAVVKDLAILAAASNPLTQQWDRLSDNQTYMFILRGAVKVDLIFDVPNEPTLPWQPSADTLPAIDAHFWDWIIWLASKESKGDRQLVERELAKLSVHILTPLGDSSVSRSSEDAIARYLPARARLEKRFAVNVPRNLERSVRSKLKRHRFPTADH